MRDGHVLGARVRIGHEFTPSGTKGARPSRVGGYEQASSTCRAVANRMSTSPLLFLLGDVAIGNIMC